MNSSQCQTWDRSQTAYLALRRNLLLQSPKVYGSSPSRADSFLSFSFFSFLSFNLHSPSKDIFRVIAHLRTFDDEALFVVLCLVSTTWSMLTHKKGVLKIDVLILSPVWNSTSLNQTSDLKSPDVFSTCELSHFLVHMWLFYFLTRCFWYIWFSQCTGSFSQMTICDYQFLNKSIKNYGSIIS